MPRYDEEDNKSRHAAVNSDYCEEMAERNGWKLVDVESTGNSILPVDCVFEGKTEFPNPYNDVEDQDA